MNKASAKAKPASNKIHSMNPSLCRLFPYSTPIACALLCLTVSFASSLIRSAEAAQPMKVNGSAQAESSSVPSPTPSAPAPAPNPACSCADNQNGETPPPSSSSRKGTLRQSNWSELSGADEKALTNPMWQSLILGCVALRSDPIWTDLCDSAAAMPKESKPEHRLAFLQARFVPWQALGSEGQTEGLATGYYEPILRGSRKPDARYRFPLYGKPDDLLTIDLESVVPELRGRRVRGRLEGNRVIPYYSRADIESEPPESLKGREIVWIDDPVEVFFLHIQGSGRVELAEGGGMHVGYADQNGQPFRSVARLLIERGELSVAQATLQGMKAWAIAHPDRVNSFLQANPSYVFFRELPGDLPGPLGTLGTPLIGEGSVAVDARIIPLGVPVFVDTTYPLSQQALKRFAMAQDTGGAINGSVRIDFFWGLGDAALAQAGRMRQKLKLWALIPNGTHPENGTLVQDTVPLIASEPRR